MFKIGSQLESIITIVGITYGKIDLFPLHLHLQYESLLRFITNKTLLLIAHNRRANTIKCYFNQKSEIF